VTGDALLNNAVALSSASSSSSFAFSFADEKSDDDI